MSLGVKGYISTTLTVWCGRCVVWEHADQEFKKAQAGEWARRHGWRLTRLDGWLCPKCARKLDGSR